MDSKFWVGEVYRLGQIYDCDFPDRATKEMALADARERISGMSAREQADMEAGAVEWRMVGEGMAESTTTERTEA